MTHVWKDKVAETTTTTGTGDITLAGAITGYRTFASVCSTNDTFDYSITAVNSSGVPTGEWETGTGTYSATNTLARTTVKDSSNSGAAVNFSAGTKRVVLTPQAQRFNISTSGYKTLDVDYTDGGNSGTSETDLFTYTVGAGELAENGDRLEAQWSGTFVSSGTATRQLRAYFGGTLIFDTSTLTISANSAWDVLVTITRVSATVVRYAVSMTTQGAALAAYTASGEVTGLTLSGTNVFKLTGTAAGVGAASNDIVGKTGHVEKRPVLAEASNGGGWKPVVPLASNFATERKHASISSPTLSDLPYGGGGVMVAQPRNTVASSWRQVYRYKSAPAGSTWRVEAMMLALQQSDATYFFDGIGCGWSGDSNKNIAIQNFFNSASDCRYGMVSTYPGLGSNTDAAYTTDGPQNMLVDDYSRPVWYALEYNSPTLSLLYSMDGFSWVRTGYLNADTYLGGAPNLVGLAHMSVSAASGTNYTIYKHWKETTDLSAALGLN